MRLLKLFSLPFGVNDLAAVLFGVLCCVLFFPILSLSDASSFIKSSTKGSLLKQSPIYKQPTEQENTMLLLADIQSRMTIMEKEIQKLKPQNENQREEFVQIKSLLENLTIDEQSNDNFTNNESKNNHSRSVRSVNTTPLDHQFKSSSAAVDVSSASWAKLEISDHVIGYMDYNSYTVKIYDHVSNKDPNLTNEEKRYFFEPIGQLNHLNAQSDFNNITKKPEMNFRVEMWTDAVRNAVHKFVSEDLKLGPLNINLVRVLPLDKVMLFSESSVSPHFEIDQSWINYKSDRFLKFRYTCDKIEYCNKLSEQMKSNAEQFRLMMRFSLSSQKSQTKQTKINIENIVHGTMMNQLVQNFKGNDVILTADGKKQLLKESSSKIIIQTFDDGDVPSATSQNEIYSTLEKLLQFSRTSIQRDDDKAWENVFWNEDNYRPDRSAKSLTELYRKLDSDNQKKLASTFTDTNKFSAEASGKGYGITARAALATDFSREGTDSKENIENLLNESRNYVEWDGLKFVPKQMDLYIMNVARLKDGQAFEDTNLKVSYLTSMLTIDVRTDSSFDKEASNQLFQHEDFYVKWIDFHLKSMFNPLRERIVLMNTTFTSNTRQITELKPVLSSTVTRVRQLSEEMQGYHPGLLIVWRIANYTTKKTHTYFLGDQYYPTDYGYKLKVELYLNGTGSGRGTHISIYISIQPGLHDTLLTWPFPYKITFTLLDQSTESTNKKMDFVYMVTPSEIFKEALKRPVSNKANVGIGTSKFVSHELLVEGGKYVKDDTLFIKITLTNEKLTSGRVKLDVYELKPNLDLALTQDRQPGEQVRELCHRFNIGPFLWRITNYRSKKADTDVTSIYSEPFYTSQFGYKLKMKAYLNGDSNGKGTHLSIYMEIQPGEYDALLPWPFSHKVTITLLDQSTKSIKKSNAELKLADSSNTKFPECFTRPLDNKVNEGIGTHKFVSHELLVEGGKYVKDDTLFIKLTTSD